VKPGTQIVYVPNHEMESYKKSGIMNFDYPSGSQPGFVACKSMKDDAVFCRYWRVTHTQEVLKCELRTTANSELTPVRNLVAMDTVPQEIVDSLMAALGYGD
jgi:hypothetical protein